MGNFCKTLPSSEQPVIHDMFSRLGKNSFILHHALGFKQFPLTRSYTVEEDSFLKTVESFQRKTVRTSANVISSYVVYKLKFDDNQALVLKARIVPHGNEDIQRQ